MIIGWPTNVNKVILDSTSITVGEGAVVTDNMEVTGVKKRRLGCANPADKFQVNMEFNFSEKDSNGYTELDRFYTWYKFNHQYGINPFEFPAILINSNRIEGYAQSEIRPGHIPDSECYVITSAVDGSKSGLCQQVKMTWETYATGVIHVQNNTVSVNSISAENGCVSVNFTDTPTTEPTMNDFSSMKINGVALSISAIVFDGNVTESVYFEPVTTPGTYTITFGNKSATFNV